MTTHPHNLSGVYALDAMPPEERAIYEQHLGECADCAAEVAGLVETSARLGAASEGAIPGHLKAQVMSAVEHTAQQRPVVTSISAASRFRKIATRASLLAAACVVIASVGGVIVEHNRADDLRAQQAQIAQVLAAPDAATVSHQAKGGGSVRLVRSAKVDKAVLLAAGLPELGDAHDYQMWTLTGGTARSAGVMSTSVISSGSSVTSSAHLLSGIDGADAVAITVEPAGGSKQPTTDPIAVLKTS